MRAVFPVPVSAPIAIVLLAITGVNRQLPDRGGLIPVSEKAFGKILQLAQVAGPAMLLAGIQQYTGKARSRHAIAPSQPVHQVPQQQWNLFPPLSQGRYAQLENAQAVKQLFLNSLLRCGHFQVAAHGRNDTHVRPDRRLAAAPDKLPRFQQFQQAPLHRARHGIEFIQQDRPLGALFELP